MNKFFEDRIEPIPESGCLIWIGNTNKSGYGKIKIHGKQKYAHRVAWEYYNGEIPYKLNILHHCDTPACVNPHHLFLGTPKDNTRDCIQKNRRVYACKEQHGNAKLTEKQIENIRADARSQRAIAKDYNISHEHVGSIKRREVWR